MSDRLDLSIITDRLAPLTSAGTVDSIERATGSNAALARGRVTQAGIYVYRQAIDVNWIGVQLREQTETIGVLTVYRATATAPDIGAAASDAVQTITEAATALLVPEGGWKPTSNSRAAMWEGGSLLLATEQVTAWEDRYSITLTI